MTGIYGVVESGYKAEDLESHIRHSGFSISSQKKTSLDVISIDGITFGYERINTSSPEQPCLGSNDDRYTIRFEGDIYNLSEIRNRIQLDNENGISSNHALILLHAFKKWGADIFSHINGLFQIAIWDSVDRVLFIACDPGGLRPIYYSQKNGFFAFASDVRTLLHIPWVSNTPDSQGIMCFLQHGFPLGDRTFFSDIKVLLGGAYAEFRDGNLKIQRYWRLHPAINSELSHNDTLDAFVDIWKDIYQRQTDDDLEYGTLLSGGLDTRLMVAGFRSLSKQVAAFTFSETATPDAILSKELSQIANYRHFYKKVSPQDVIDGIPKVITLTDGMFNYFNANIHHLHESIGKRADVIFDGITILDSFSYTVQAYFIKYVQRLSKDGWLKLALSSNYNLARFPLGDRTINLINPKSEIKPEPFRLNEFLQQYINDATDHVGHDPFCMLTLFDFEERQRRFTSFGPGLLRPVAIVRCPFFDKKLLDFISRVSFRYRSKDKVLQTHGVRTLSPELARVPWDRTGMPLDTHPIKLLLTFGTKVLVNKFKRFVQQKTRFPFQFSPPLVNYDKMIRERDSFRKMVSSLLEKSQSEGSGMFDTEGVQELLQHHLTHKGDHASILGRLVTIEVWHRLFISKRDIPYF